MHLEGNAAKWWQAYKQKHTKITWLSFCLAIKQEFGADDYCSALNDLIALKQTGTVEEYTTQFQALQFGITMHSCHYDDLFFTSHYVSGLKDEIRAVVEPQVPTTVNRAAIIARIQQKVVDRSKLKFQRNAPGPKHNAPPRADARPNQSPGTLWRDRQLRDYKKANGLCYSCGEKYEPGHNELCAKRAKPHANALIVNDQDRELSDDVLNQLAIEDALPEQFCQLSLNAISVADNSNCIKLKTRVNNKVMLILVDSGSSHSFVSSSFVQMAGLSTTAIPPRQVKLANGETIVTDKMVSNLQLYCQGHTLASSMIVLDMHPYDAILGFDWLQQHSPMSCDWAKKTLEFNVNGRPVKLQGLRQQPLELHSMSAHKVFNSVKGNDIWAFVLVDHVPPSPVLPSQPTKSEPQAITQLLQSYQDVFSDPKKLPPQCSYDHAIPLIPGSVPINSKPYHYSPQHKNEIEQQVQDLLKTGLIAHSHSPFTSPVLLVKKKDGSWRFCMDYRKLNNLTIKNRFPMPIIEEILDELSGAKFFTKLDMRSGYHQIRMLPEDEYKTTFKTHHGHYQFKVMPFGLTNALATFQCVRIRSCILF